MCSASKCQSSCWLKVFIYSIWSRPRGLEVENLLIYKWVFEQSYYIFKFVLRIWGTFINLNILEDYIRLPSLFQHRFFLYDKLIEFEPDTDSLSLIWQVVSLFNIELYVFNICIFLCDAAFLRKNIQMVVVTSVPLVGLHSDQGEAKDTLNNLERR